MDVGHYQVVATAPAIDCHSPTYGHWRVAILVLMVLDIVGLPLAVLAWLCSHRTNMATARHDPDDAFGRRYGVLFQAFKNKQAAPYWQSWILVRRCMLAAISVVHAANLRFVLFTLATFAFFLMHMLARPYRNRRLNRVESAALGIHVVMATILTGFAGDVAQQPTLPVQVLLCLLVVVPSLTLLALLALERWVWPRWRKGVKLFPQRSVHMERLLSAQTM